MKACAVEGCKKVSIATRPYDPCYCPEHLSRWRRWGDPLLPPWPTCAVTGCDEPVTNEALCPVHYWSRPSYVARGMTCAVDGCDREATSRGWCAMHYQRVRKTGDPGPVGPVLVTHARKTCSVEGCGREVSGRGLCRTHYRIDYRKRVGK